MRPPARGQVGGVRRQQVQEESFAGVPGAAGRLVVDQLRGAEIEVEGGAGGRLAEGAGGQRRVRLQMRVGGRPVGGVHGEDGAVGRHRHRSQAGRREELRYAVVVRDHAPHEVDPVGVEPDQVRAVRRGRHQFLHPPPLRRDGVIGPGAGAVEVRRGADVAVDPAADGVLPEVADDRRIRPRQRPEAEVRLAGVEAPDLAGAAHHLPGGPHGEHGQQDRGRRPRRRRGVRPARGAEQPIERAGRGHQQREVTRSQQPGLPGLADGRDRDDDHRRVEQGEAAEQQDGMTRERRPPRPLAGAREAGRQQRRGGQRQQRQQRPGDAGRQEVEVRPFPQRSTHAGERPCYGQLGRAHGGDVLDELAGGQVVAEHPQRHGHGRGQRHDRDAARPLPEPRLRLAEQRQTQGERRGHPRVAGQERQGAADRRPRQCGSPAVGEEPVGLDQRDRRQQDEGGFGHRRPRARGQGHRQGKRQGCPHRQQGRPEAPAQVVAHDEDRQPEDRGVERAGDGERVERPAQAGGGQQHRVERRPVGLRAAAEKGIAFAGQQVAGDPDPAQGIAFQPRPPGHLPRQHQRGRQDRQRGHEQQGAGWAGARHGQNGV